MINRISESERKEEFYGVEGMVHVENDGMRDFSKYVPTDMSKVKAEPKHTN